METRADTEGTHPAALDDPVAAAAAQDVRRAPTLTFLFTDIEGSTQLEQRLGVARYASVRERHRALLRAAFGAAGGAEQGTEGDSFFVTFPGARDAVTAAAAAQRALASEPWPDDARVAVRMGIHSGEASLVGGSLVGIDINRAARIAAAGHGGQVVVSAVTRALAGESPGAGLSWLDLGVHSLKDLPTPERLAQLVVTGLPSEFPRLRGTVGAGDLPGSPTTFVGRAREVEELSVLLGANRLLTLTGPGGTGKTRLALEVARRCEAWFPDGAWWVPLEADHRARPGRRRPSPSACGSPIGGLRPGGAARGAPRGPRHAARPRQLRAADGRGAPGVAATGGGAADSRSWSRAARRCGSPASRSTRCRRSSAPDPATVRDVTPSPDPRPWRCSSSVPAR